MISQKRGLTINVSALAAHKTDSGVAYCVAKNADDKMAACMAHDLREHNIAVVSIYPGLVRTEAVLKAAQHFNLSNSESPEFQGRVVAALASDPYIMNKSGRWFITAELAEEYGIIDVDGKRPTSLRNEIPS
jgi:NAD(P)-dependent dehydrogenase (short-subunit alcohol dehydrogenase family)